MLHWYDEVLLAIKTETDKYALAWKDVRDVLSIIQNFMYNTLIL